MLERNDPNLNLVITKMLEVIDLLKACNCPPPKTPLHKSLECEFQCWLTWDGKKYANQLPFPLRSDYATFFSDPELKEYQNLLSSPIPKRNSLIDYFVAHSNIFKLFSSVFLPADCLVIVINTEFNAAKKNNFTQQMNHPFKTELILLNANARLKKFKPADYKLPETTDATVELCSQSGVFKTTDKQFSSAVIALKLRENQTVSLDKIKKAIIDPKSIRKECSEAKSQFFLLEALINDTPRYPFKSLPRELKQLIPADIAADWDDELSQDEQNRFFKKYEASLEHKKEDSQFGNYFIKLIISITFLFLLCQLINNLDTTPKFRPTF